MVTFSFGSCNIWIYWNGTKNDRPDPFEMEYILNQEKSNQAKEELVNYLQATEFDCDY